MAGFVLLAVALFGGASRADEPAQVLVRIAAIAVIAATLWPLDFAALKANRCPLLFALACVALVLLQLVPLPPAAWASLPGHASYEAIAEATSTVGWRPLSLTPDLTVNALLALLAPLASMLAALYLDANGRKVVAGGYAVAALASAALGLAQLAVTGEGLRLYRQTSETVPVGLFANQNHQAVLLACALPLGAAIVPLRSRQLANVIVPVIGLSAAAFLSVVLVLTGSRMGLVVGAGGILGLCWILRDRALFRRPDRLRILMPWIATGGLALALVVTMLLVDNQLLQRLRAQDVAADTRWTALPYLLETARAFFPTGAGFGSFDSVYRQFEPDMLLSTIYLNQAHNEALQLAIEGGLPALALLLGFMLWWARSITIIVRRRGTEAQRGLPLAASVVTLLLMISSLVDYPLHTPLLAALFAFCCVEMARAAGRGGPPEHDP